MALLLIARETPSNIFAQADASSISFRKQIIIVNMFKGSARDDLSAQNSTIFFASHGVDAVVGFVRLDTSPPSTVLAGYHPVLVGRHAFCS